MSSQRRVQRGQAAALPVPLRLLLSRGDGEGAGQHLDLLPLLTHPLPRLLEQRKCKTIPKGALSRSLCWSTEGE